MFENNVKELYAMDWNYPDGFWETFFKMQTEPERLALLHTKYVQELHRFEGIPLWEEGTMPDPLDDAGNQEPPAIYFYPCSTEPKGTVLVVPGGAYSCIATEVEGYPIIQKLLESGYSAALLIYRLKPYTQYQSLQDIKRALKLIRYRGEDLGIADKPLFVMGGSAGGHLCTMASVHYDLENSDAKDPIERMSSRPDGAIISYGVFTQVSYPVYGAFVKMREEEDSPLSMLKSCYSDKYRRDMVFFSPEKHVTPDTPPMFLWQTCDDDDPRNLFLLAKELADCGVRFETHIFPYGEHGNGLWDGNSGKKVADPHVAHWFQLAVEWMDLTWEKNNGFKTD